MEQTKKLLLDVNEKPTIAKWIILALQHVFCYVWSNDFSSYHGKYSSR